MTLAPVRRALHASHGLLTVTLLATGLLMGFPELRGRLVGGYGAEIWDLHLGMGAAWLAAPALALLAAGRALGRDTLRRLGPPEGLTWVKLHIAASLLLSLLVGASGVVLWRDRSFPLAWVDASLVVHEWASWALCAFLGVHLVAVRRRLAARLRGQGTEEGEQGDPLLLAEDD